MTTPAVRRRRLNADDQPPFETEDKPTARTVRRATRTKAVEEVEEPEIESEVEEIEEIEMEQPEPPVRRTRPRAAVQEEEVEDAEPSEDVVVPSFDGWDSSARARKAGSVSSRYFRWDDETKEPQLVRFLDVPLKSYYSRWVKRTGRQSFPSLGDNDPLGSLGIRKSQKWVWQIINYSHPEGPTLQTIEVSSRVFDILAGYEKDKKSGPLPRHYYSLARVPKVGGNNFDKYTYQIQVVKERDLEEDWGLDPQEAREIYEDIEAMPREDMIPRVTMAELRAVAEEIMGMG